MQTTRESAARVVQSLTVSLRASREAFPTVAGPSTSSVPESCRSVIGRSESLPGAGVGAGSAPFPGAPAPALGEGARGQPPQEQGRPPEPAPRAAGGPVVGGTPSGARGPRQSPGVLVERGQPGRGRNPAVQDGGGQLGDVDIRPEARAPGRRQGLQTAEWKAFGAPGVLPPRGGVEDRPGPPQSGGLLAQDRPGGRSPLDAARVPGCEGLQGRQFEDLAGPGVHPCVVLRQCRHVGGELDAVGAAGVGGRLQFEPVQGQREPGRLLPGRVKPVDAPRPQPQAGDDPGRRHTGRERGRQGAADGAHLFDLVWARDIDAVARGQADVHVDAGGQRHHHQDGDEDPRDDGGRGGQRGQGRALPRQEVGRGRRRAVAHRLLLSVGAAAGPDSALAAGASTSASRPEALTQR